MQNAAQSGVAAGPQRVHLRTQRLGGQHVEGGEGLIHAEQLRPADQGARDADALLHAARQLLRIRLFEAFEPDQVDDVRDARGLLLRG